MKLAVRLQAPYLSQDAATTSIRIHNAEHVYVFGNSQAEDGRTTASEGLQESAALLQTARIWRYVKEAVGPCRADVSIDHRPAPAEMQPKRQGRVDRL